MVPGVAMQTVVTSSMGTRPSHTRSFASNLPDSTVYGGPQAFPSTAAHDKGRRTQPSPTTQPCDLLFAPIHRTFASVGVNQIPNPSELPLEDRRPWMRDDTGQWTFVSERLSIYPDTHHMVCCTSQTQPVLPQALGGVCRKPRDAALAAREVQRRYQAQHAHRLRLSVRRSRTPAPIQPYQTLSNPIKPPSLVPSDRSRPTTIPHNLVSMHCSTVSTSTR
jgi:hypothetical protein